MQLNSMFYAGVAQQVEQLTCNQQVGGSIPSASSKTDFDENQSLFYFVLNVNSKLKL